MAALIRFGPVLLDPIFSSDIYRYVWEGRIQIHGGWNPFLHPPASPALIALRDGTWEFINHPELSAIYGGFAQLLFAAVAALAGGAVVLGLKLVTAGADLLNVVLIRRLATPRGNGAWPLVLYAWNPACALEFGWSGHLDSILILLILAAILASRKGMPGMVGACVALAAAIKWWPAVLILPALAALPKSDEPSPSRRSVLRLAGTFLGVSLLVWSPYITAGPALFHSLRVMKNEFQFNPSIFTLVEEAVRGLAGPWLRDDMHQMPQIAQILGLSRAEDPAGQIARWLLAGVGGVLIGVLLWRRETLAFAAYAISAYLIIASPVVHPWYILLPLALSLILGRGVAAWTWLSIAASLTYFAYVRWPLHELVWIRLLEYVPFYALLLSPRVLASLRLKHEQTEFNIIREPIARA